MFTVEVESQTAVRLGPTASNRARGGRAVASAAVVLLLMAGALFVRVDRMGETLLTFHPTRQYRSAIIARSCYYDATPAVSETLRRVAAANRGMQPAGEPPLLEWIACGAYRLSGREILALPRVLSGLFWVLGALPLYFLARRAGRAEGAVVALAVYLFLPYGILATRSFMPDPLMTLCSVAALMAIVRYDEHPAPARLLAAALAIALAAVVKPMSVFLTLPPLAGLSVERLGWKRALTSGPLCLLLLIALLPAAIVYGHGMVAGTLVRDQFRMRFVPSLLPSSFFWKGWLTQIRRVFGLPLFALALAAIPLAPRGGPRRLQASLWIGYALFAVAFTYHVPTHNYYHLPFVAAAALGTASIVGRLGRALAGRVSPPAMLRAAIAAAVVIAFAGSVMAWPRLTSPSAAQVVQRFEEIGAVANHDTKVIFLDREYGYPLMYHGQISGDAWPNEDDLAAQSIGGMPALDAEQRFVRDYAHWGPRYFVVTDLASLDAQPDLVRLLARRAMVVKKTPAYHVYRFSDVTP